MNLDEWRPDDTIKQAIFMIEALGLLHDIGKLSDEFVRYSSSDRPQDFKFPLTAVVDPHKIYGPAQPRAAYTAKPLKALYKAANDSQTIVPFRLRSDLTDKLATLQFRAWDNELYSLAELLPLAKPNTLKHKETLASDLKKSMAPALLVGYLHGAAHYEKEGPPGQGKQPYGQTYRSTPFGYETHIDLSNNNGLTNLLRQLPLPSSDFRDRRDWLRQVRPFLEAGLADTRRPTNEVTLWDWGYMIASLAKAVAVTIYREGWTFPLDNIKIRTLCVALDRLEIYSRADRMNDLLGLRQVLDAAYDEVRKLIEEELVLGNCIYHDETGAYFLIPDAELTPDIRNQIHQCFPRDLRPRLFLGESISIGELDPSKNSEEKNISSIKRLITAPRAVADAERGQLVDSSDNYFAWEDVWTNHRAENAAICNVCNLRPVGFPEHKEDEPIPDAPPWVTAQAARERGMCRICLARQSRPTRDWAKTEFKSTVWIDEIADSYGRLALMVGKLDLDGWLDGTLISSLRVDAKNAKNPSPARLYRIAEAARVFWVSTQEKIVPAVVGQRSNRLALYVDKAQTSTSDLIGYYGYELDLGDVRLPVTWDSKQNRLITVENLDYFLRRSNRLGHARARLSQTEALTQLLEEVPGETYCLHTSSEYARPGKPLLQIRIAYAEAMAPYVPAIHLLAEPSLCLVLVPAQYAFTLVQKIKEKYEDELGRVRDRLPLYLGLVFAPRRTPLHTIIKAGRSMLGMSGKWQWEPWTVTANEPETTEKGVGTRRIRFDNEVMWRVPVKVGDGSIDDNTYPNWLLTQPDQGTQIKSCYLHNISSEGSETSETKVFVRASRFDYEFLDTSGRRFDIRYNGAAKRLTRMTRPFRLEDIDRLTEIWEALRHLARSQQVQLVQSIEATREAWYPRTRQLDAQNDPVFRQFVHDTLAGASWSKNHPWHELSPQQQERLIDAGVTGVLVDVLELFTQILHVTDFPET